MKKLCTLSAALFLAVLSWGQSDEPAGAPTLTVDFYSLGANTAGSLAAASASNLPGTCFAGSVDGYYAFVAQSQGVKIDCTTGAFDMALEVRDAGETWLDCQDANAGVGGETMWVTGLTTGNTYYVSITSIGAVGGGTFNVKVEWLPNVEVRGGYYPNPSPESGLPGYKIAETTRRTLNSAFPASIAGFVTGSRWRFTAQSDASVYTADVGGNNQLLNLNTVTGLCFSEVYDVEVQVQIEGQWCGYSIPRSINMESEPTTILQPVWVNGTYDLSASIQAAFIGSEGQLYWRLTTDNGNTVVDFNYPNNPTTELNLPDPDCLRFNKIYSVEIAAEYCGQIGSYSTPVNIFTMNVPYTKVRTEYCGTNQFIGATILCDFINSVDTYAWQFGPIVEDDPDMIPIGPAIVAYTDNTDIFLLGLASEGLESGQAYRVGVKPLLGVDAAGNVDACNEVQEGDYGQFCQVVILPSSPPGEAPGIAETENSEERNDVEIIGDGDEIDIYRVGGSTHVLQMWTRSEELSGNALLQVFDMNGRLVHQTGYALIEQADMVQESIPTDLPAGIYIVTLQSQTGAISEKIYID